MAAEQATITTATGYGGLTQYVHDSKNQLTEEQSSAVGGYTNGFGYDGAGNPTTWKGSGQGFNADNQSTASAYDGNGNPTAYKGQSLAFDAENRLTQYGTAMLAGYTGDGLRAWKQTGAGRTYFLYDDTSPICELSAGGAITAVNTFSKHGLLSRHTAVGSVFYAFDPHGNATQRLDSGGNVLSTQRFDGFGSRVSTDNNTDPLAGFCGQAGYYTDWETGLQLLTYRYYDPSLGRFLTRDPSGYTGGVNIYEYCGNGPTVKEDPLGLWTLFDTLTAVLACGTTIELLLLAGSVHGRSLDSAEFCQSVTDCLSAILGVIIAVGATASVGPAAAGCLAGLAAGFGRMVGAVICHALHCNSEPLNVPCMIVDLTLGFIFGCVTGGIFGDVTANSPVNLAIKKAVFYTFGVIFGYEMEHMCTASSEGNRNIF